MNILTQHIVDRILRNGGSAERRAIYEYAVGVLVSMLLTSSALFVFACLLGAPLELLCWDAFFLPLRVTAGGIHARTSKGCFLLSIIVVAACLLLVPVIGHILTAALLVGISFSAMAIIFFAPVPHPHHPLPIMRVRKSRKYARALFAVESTTLSILYLCGATDMVACGLLGMLAATVSTFIGGIRIELTLTA